MLQKFHNYIKSLEKEIGNGAEISVHFILENCIDIDISWKNIKPRLCLPLQFKDEIDADEFFNLMIEYAKYCYSYFKNDKEKLEWDQWLESRN